MAKGSKKRFSTVAVTTAPSAGEPLPGAIPEQPLGFESTQEATAGEGRVQARAIPLDELAHNPLNPREQLLNIDKLAASLKSRGQVQTIAVIPTAVYLAAAESAGRTDVIDKISDAPYVVLVGNRRLAAAAKAGLSTLDSVIRSDVTWSDIRTIPISENIDRDGFNPIEEANAIADRVAELRAAGSKRPQADVAEQLGKEPAYVSQRMALRKLTPELQNLVREGSMPIEVGRNIGRLDQDLQPVAWETYQVGGDYMSAKAQPQPEEAAEIPAPERSLVSKPPFTRTVAGLRRVIQRERPTPGAFAESFCNQLEADIEPEYIRALAERLAQLADVAS